ncbi:unnamed protein product, partial [marine sediment metagenome]
EELHTAFYREDRGYIRVDSGDVFKDKIKRSPDRFMALCMTHADGIVPQPEPPVDITEVRKKNKLRRQAWNV